MALTSPFLADERQKLIAGLLVMPEGAEHRAGHCLAALFFYAAHLHAQVARLDDDAHAMRSNFLLNRFRDLASQALLNLQAPGKHVHQTRDLAEAEHALVW